MDRKIVPSLWKLVTIFEIGIIGSCARLSTENTNVFFFPWFLPVLRSMVTATAFQIFVSNNAAIKAVTDNAVVTLEVRVDGRRTR